MLKSRRKNASQIICISECREVKYWVKGGKRNIAARGRFGVFEY